MTKREKFDVEVAAFEALLRRNELWKEFLINFKMRNPDYSMGEPYDSWREWAFITPTHQWIASAFFWDTTPQGSYMWRDLDYDWLKWICRHLIKY